MLSRELSSHWQGELWLELGWQGRLWLVSWVDQRKMLKMLRMANLSPALLTFLTSPSRCCGQVTQQEPEKGIK